MVSWPEPRCFIEYDPDGHFHVNAETLAELRKVPAPISPVSIVGPYRTGKSYLLNLLAGFDLGSSIQAQTKGIWVWCVPNPSQAGQTMVLLDTEGLGDVERGDPKSDMNICILSLLLSSTMIYNTKGTIDDRALQELHFITEASKHLRMDETDSDDDDEDNYAIFFPMFIWTVRDFTLRLDIDGKSCSMNEYLDLALKTKLGAGRKTDEFNLPRKLLRLYFPKRACFTFPPPVEAKRMEKLDELKINKLDKKFQKVSSDFEEFVISQTKPKLAYWGTEEISGSVLGDLAVSYVGAISSGKVLCIKSAIAEAAFAQNIKAKKQAMDMYTDEFVACVKIPTDTIEEITQMHEKLSKSAMTKLVEMAMFDFEDEQSKTSVVTELENDMQAHFEQMCIANEKTSKTTCEALLTKLTAKMKDKIDNGGYLVPGGYECFTNDLKEIKEKYTLESKGVKATEVHEAFLEWMEPTKQTVLHIDDILTQQEREVKEREAEQDAIHRKKQADEQRTQRQQAVREAEERRKRDTQILIQQNVKQKASVQDSRSEALTQSRREEAAKFREEGQHEVAEHLELEKEKSSWFIGLKLGGMKLGYEWK